MVPFVRIVLATGPIGAGIVSDSLAAFFAVPVAWHYLGGGFRFGSRSFVPAGAVIGVPKLQRSLLSRTEDPLGSAASKSGSSSLGTARVLGHSKTQRSEVICVTMSTEISMMNYGREDARPLYNNLIAACVPHA